MREGRERDTGRMAFSRNLHYPVKLQKREEERQREREKGGDKGSYTKELTL